ncbi:MAG TPA: hypothetical protein VHC95_05560 [Opitutales bacterium]|nr:hypothetical protein [Opitutales bacterium]
MEEEDLTTVPDWAKPSWKREGKDSNQANFSAELTDYLSKGWKITSDGPTGIQLEGPKLMKGLDKACLVLGILTFWFGMGFVFIAVAMLDYWFMTKPEVKFIPRL